MTEENRPFIGYRPAGRRPEAQQDRRAAADAPLSALRGMVSGVLGAPGDIESLVRMLPGLNEQTVLPTSEDIEKRLPMRELNQTPTGRAFTTAGQLGGGFYTGPGSPLHAVAAAARASPQAFATGMRNIAAPRTLHPQAGVVKMKGGNWLAGSVERAVEPMKQGPLDGGRELINAGLTTPELMAANPDVAMNKWLETKLAKYIKNEMATPEDPIRALAERGITHAEIQPTGYNVTVPRSFAGFPEEGMAKSPEAKRWEDKSDSFVNQLVASDITRGYPGEIERNQWLLKVPPDTRVYSMLHGADEDLGFAHLTDELRNAINPASGLPANLLWKYQDLDKVTVPQAVERVAKINEWRAAHKAEADAARAMNPATQVVKEYPEQGFKWVELRQPKDEIVTRGEYADPAFDIPPAAQEAIQNQAEREVRRLGLEDESDEYIYAMQDRIQELSQDYAAKNKPLVSKALEDALKYEGETMGHCVGGYCPDVLEGRSKIYSLRDKKGQPHVTIEVQPGQKKTLDKQTVREYLTSEEAPMYFAAANDPSVVDIESQLKASGLYDVMAKRLGLFDEPPMDIVQIKGKANKAPNPEYLPAVQDFIRSGNFGKVGDLQNAGLVQLPDKRFITNEQFDEAISRISDGGDRPTNKWFMNVMRGDPSWWEEMKGAFEGFSRGGQVRGYQAGGAVRSLPELHARYAEGGAVTGVISPTDDFDPARIDAIVDELHAMNAA